ncbi:MAG: 3-deoxy-manno-octulosonate cytidylyltransferase [Pseudomonadales bacterium]|nr:3-deoxy-manno-octulosonate cytidylyltransferase [Pseudomonadales bacterium]
MPFHIVIPARYASSRLPGKPLIDLAGKTMIQRVYERAQQSEAESIVIATDDSRVAAAAEGFGAQVCMTSEQHLSGTDRIQEAVDQMGFSADQIVVNVQGDEPLIPAAVINQVAKNLSDNPAADISTLSIAIRELEELMDPNAVKVVADTNQYALYFSRAPIPYARDQFSALTKEGKEEALSCVNYQRHIGIYAYRVGFLDEFIHWPPAEIEQTESLEQLRALWNGKRIHVEEACEIPPAGIDTPEDAQRVREILERL